jgi:hypothetical protein
MILQKLLVYFLCIAVIAFVYVYKVPIFCSECEKPTGFAKNIFRCVVDEDKLCTVSHELQSVKQYATDFIAWLGDIVTTHIPKAVMEEISKIWKAMEPITRVLADIIGKVGYLYDTIKREFIDKVTKTLSDLTTNILDMFVNIKDGVVNMAGLIYQSMDNIRHNLMIKITDAIESVQTQIQTHIFDPIATLVAQMGDVFSKMQNFFTNIPAQLIKPFNDLARIMGEACIPEFQIIGEMDFKILKIPPLKFNRICPFNAITDAIKGIANGISSAFAAVIEPLTKPFTDLATSITAFKQTLTLGINTVKKFVTGTIDEVTKFIKNAFGNIIDAILNIKDQIVAGLIDGYKFIKDKITEIANAILQFFTDSFRKLLDEIGKIFEPIALILIQVWKTVSNLFKNFIASLNELYKSVNEKWKMVYGYIKARIFYLIYIAYINIVSVVVQYIFIPALFIPMSKTLRVNIFNGFLVIAAMGAMNYYYNFFNRVVYTSTNAILTGIGDLYSIIAGVFGKIDEYIVPLTYGMLTNVPTLKFAMDTLGFLSPLKIIPTIVNFILGIVEIIVGMVKDTFMIFPTTTAFITVFIVAIIYGIHRYFSAGTVSTFSLLLDALKSNYEKITIKSVDTEKIDNLQKRIVAEAKTEPTFERVQMSGGMEDFQRKMDDFKRRVDRIKEVRNMNKADPNDDVVKTWKANYICRI